MPDNRESLGRALEALAAVTVTAGDPELAATLFGAADGVRRSIGAGVWMTDRASHDQTAAELQTELGDTAYAAATDRGRSLTVQAVLGLTRPSDLGANDATRLGGRADSTRTS